jgi:hypothetical protein
MVFGGERYIVGREPGPQTVTGAGDTLIDNHGRRYREIDAAEAQSIRNSTGGTVFTIDPYGRIR